LSYTSGKLKLGDVLPYEPVEIDMQSFAKAWVAGLIDRDVVGVRPHEQTDRRGFERVVETLDKEVDRLSKEGAQELLILSLVKIANELRPSRAGDYEGFESALRSLQLTFTASPNPWYDYISFPVSKPNAKSFLEGVSSPIRHIADIAAQAFVNTKPIGQQGNAPRETSRA
jgi:hypothetical protein